MLDVGYQTSGLSFFSHIFNLEFFSQLEESYLFFFPFQTIFLNPFIIHYFLSHHSKYYSIDGIITFKYKKIFTFHINLLVILDVQIIIFKTK